ncbi:MAG: outer membrane lipoprotein-sorting protein, partial [Gammaproteobacteria bacterium]|nr:outer membrane lipoprotein-sorting protein [Gammaproteobacteria bacterium]
AAPTPTVTTPKPAAKPVAVPDGGGAKSVTKPAAPPSVIAKPATPTPSTVPAPAASISANDLPRVEEIISRCDYKYAGEDNKSQLSIKLMDRNNNERTTVYLRLWKAYKGEDDLLEKMLLFTFYPPDAEGAAFMRWAFTSAAHRNAEQWIYLPVMRNIRRVSVRDLADSFLGSDLTYGDITERRVEDDAHTLIQIDTDPANGQQYWVVASVPKESDSIYGRKIQWYKKTADWAECVKERVDYYDKRGLLLKRQMLKWQRVDRAWAWDKVTVQNFQTFHNSEFIVKKVQVNIGLKDESFSERRMQLGLK